MKECDNSTRKIHISINFLLSISLLIMFDTLLLRPSLHCSTPLHLTTLHHTSPNYTSDFTTLHPTTLHYAYRHFASSHLHFTTLLFSFTHLHFLSFYFTSHHITRQYRSHLQTCFQNNKLLKESCERQALSPSVKKISCMREYEPG